MQEKLEKLNLNCLKHFKIIPKNCPKNFPKNSQNTRPKIVKFEKIVKRHYSLSPQIPQSPQGNLKVLLLRLTAQNKK